MDLALDVELRWCDMNTQDGCLGDFLWTGQFGGLPPLSAFPYAELIV